MIWEDRVKHSVLKGKQVLLVTDPVERQSSPGGEGQHIAGNKLECSPSSESHLFTLLPRFLSLSLFAASISEVLCSVEFTVLPLPGDSSQGQIMRVPVLVKQ